MSEWDYQRWRERIVYDHLEDIIRSAERAINDLHESEIKRAAVEDGTSDDHLTGTTEATRIAYARGWDDAKAYVLEALIKAYGPDIHDKDRRLIESVRQGRPAPRPQRPDPVSPS